MPWSHIDGYFPLPLDRLPNAETFLLKVQGESMVNAGILDGDYVLVEQQETADNGEKVVALLEDSATVKTFYREDGFCVCSRKMIIWNRSLFMEICRF